MTYNELEQEWLSSDDYIIAHTSGSTGKPKEILLPKRQLEASARRSIDFFGLDTSSILYSCISPDFIGGKMVWIRSKVCGCRFAMESPSMTPLDSYRGDSIDLLSVVPSQMNHILNNPSIWPLLKKVLIGGSSVSADMRQRIVEAGIEAYESYGMTETASHVAVRRIEIPQSPFKLLRGVTASKEKGCLKISIEGWKSFLTNDIVEFLSSDSFNILGRNDNVIISGGKKIFPEKLEAILSGHLQVPFYITSASDPLWGERVVLATSDADINDDEILSICRKVLPRHWIPKEIRHIDAIPMTSNGKIRRK